jgi:Heterokaryon incompatibility protein (HET)
MRLFQILTAAQICINQQNIVERSHHVAFMGEIYRHARKVLVCMGEDTDGRAEDVLSLVHDVSELISKYKSVADMPVLRASDPLYADSRWKAMATFHTLPWFTRAWVIQEVGIAKDPRVLYGQVEFSYRDLMKLATWTMRCAPSLDPIAGISFFSVHTDWADFSDNWRDTATYPGEDLVDLVNQARWLSCKDPRDHIYSLLGHPLAQIDGRSGSGVILDPDYTKDHMDVWFDLAALLIAKHGPRVLSPVEHNESNLASDYPSWVPWCWPEEYTMCTLGAYYGFYYNADGGMSVPPSAEKPTVDEKRQLHVRGIAIDSVKDAFAFTTDDLAATPAKLRSMASSPTASSAQPSTEPQYALRSVWQHLQNLVARSETAYSTNWLEAFSLTLIAGITAYESAEKDIVQHRRDFAAYFLLWLQGIFGPNSPEFETMRPTLTHWKRGEDTPKGDSEETKERDDGGDDVDVDPEKFYVDMKLMCDGRSFFFTEKGYFGLGSWIAKPGDRVCVMFGAKCPFLLREWSADAGTEKRYKLVQDAYVHMLMRGEAIEQFKKGEFAEESFVIC